MQDSPPDSAATASYEGARGWTEAHLVLPVLALPMCPRVHPLMSVPVARSGEGRSAASAALCSADTTPLAGAPHSSWVMSSRTLYGGVGFALFYLAASPPRRRASLAGGFRMAAAGHVFATARKRQGGAMAAWDGGAGRSPAALLLGLRQRSSSVTAEPCRDAVPCVLRLGHTIHLALGREAHLPMPDRCDRPAMSLRCGKSPPVRPSTGRGGFGRERHRGERRPSASGAPSRGSVAPVRVPPCALRRTPTAGDRGQGLPRRTIRNGGMTRPLLLRG